MTECMHEEVLTEHRNKLESIRNEILDEKNDIYFSPDLDQRMPGIQILVGFLLSAFLAFEGALLCFSTGPEIFIVVGIFVMVSSTFPWVVWLFES